MQVFDSLWNTGELVINGFCSPEEAVVAIAENILNSKNSYKFLKEFLLHNESGRVHLVHTAVKYESISSNQERYQRDFMITILGTESD